MAQSIFNKDKTSSSDSLEHLPLRVRRAIENGWSGPFHDHILSILREPEVEILFSPLYSPNSNTRPATPTHIVLALFLIKHLKGLTDEEPYSCVHADVAFQYAIGTVGWSDQPVNERTLNRLRTKCELYRQETGIDLIQTFFDQLAKKQVNRYLGRKSRIRMDSLMVSGNARHLSRLGLSHVVVSNAALALEEYGYHSILPESMHHYLDDFDENKPEFPSPFQPTKSMHLLYDV